MTSLLIAAGVSFLVAVLTTPLLIRALRRRGIGQQIRDDGPIEHPHVRKAGTPTMGGVVIVAGAVLGYLVPHVRTNDVRFSNSGKVLVLLIIGLAVVGGIDDWLGIRQQRNLGLRKRGKLAGQLLVGMGFALLALRWVDVSTHLSFTRDLDLDLGTWLWVAWAVFMVTAASNAVNITDGLDGLVAGSAALAFSAYVIIGFWQFRHFDIYGVEPAHALDISILAAAMLGGCAGFLWWNAAPARIFMGDTGSLPIGGALAGMALLTRTHLLLPVLGGLYLIETLSVIAQIISFRGFKRRVFRMAPIHHHFEVIGWPETTVIIRFWLLAGMAVATGIAMFYSDFINVPGAID